MQYEHVINGWQFAAVLLVPIVSIAIKDLGDRIDRRRKLAAAKEDAATVADQLKKDNEEKASQIKQELKSTAATLATQVEREHKDTKDSFTTQITENTAISTNAFNEGNHNTQKLLTLQAQVMLIAEQLSAARKVDADRATSLQQERVITSQALTDQINESTRASKDALAESNNTNKKIAELSSDLKVVAQQVASLQEQVTAITHKMGDRNV